MIKLNKKLKAPIFILVLVVFGLNVSVKEVRAQVFVPVYDALSHATAQLQYIEDIYTSIATGAQTIKEVGNVPGVSPLATAAVNQGTAAGLSLTSLDFSANFIAKMIIKRITDSVVGWIDSGFQGQPAFVTNPQEFLLDVADSVAGEFIEGSALGFMCQPFQLDLKFTLYKNYQSTFTDVTCRLSDVLNNIENFAEFTGGNFAKGGWDGWFQVIQPNNNPYGAYARANTELNTRISVKIGDTERQWDWGSGFLSFQECLDEDEDGNLIEDRPLSECTNKGPIKTPGAVIESGLSDTLGTELSELELADSFDRIIAALLNQLVSKALSSSGLLGSSGGSYDEYQSPGSGNLTFPPSPPTSLVAIPSTTQVSLSWTESPTQEVNGYYIYRDGRKIGTNSGRNTTFYLDSGLQPQTNYSYIVGAFVENDNESKSNTVATSTLPLP